MDDWIRLQRKYPQVAFNWKSFDGTFNSPEKGFRVLIQCEPWTNMPEQWDVDLLRKYEHVFTFNRMFYEMYKQVLPHLYWMRGVLACNTHKYKLEEWPRFEDRLSGVCALNNYYSLNRSGDILCLRPEVMANLDKHLVSHVWCSPERKWGGASYQGQVDAPIHHSHVNHLKKISEYTFCLCMESTYHPFWSLGFVTERMFNCFKAKTIPIYLGCYDIEEYVPEHFFIDFRRYRHKNSRDYDGLNKLLLDIICHEPVREEWKRRMEEAYNWNLNQKFGSVPDLEAALDQIFDEDH